MLRHHLRNERGGALPIVLIILVVFSIYGVSLLSISVADSKHANFQEDRTQAYYLARSGAEALSSYIVNNLENLTQEEREAFIDSIDNKTSSPTKLNPADGGYFEVRLVKSEAELTIYATGVIEDSNIRETVTLKLLREVIPGETPDPIPTFDMAFFATASGTQSNPAIKMSGSTTIKGSVGTNTTGDRSIQLAWSNYMRDGVLYIGPDADPNSVVQGPQKLTTHIPSGVQSLAEVREYPMPVFPEFPTGLPPRGDLRTVWIEGEFYPIYNDGYYNEIAGIEGRTITIDLGGGDRIIRVKNLNISQGFVKLQNIGENGRLIFYVEDSFTMGGSSTINQGGSIDRVMIYYAGSATVNLGDNTRHVGNIFVKDAPINIANSGGIIGNIISGGSNINVSGNADANTRILYAPNAHIDISGSGKIKGAVVGKSFDISGGSSPAIHFLPPDLSQFPTEVFSGGGNNGGGNSSEDMINYQLGGWR